MIKGEHFKVDITSNTSKHLELALELVFAETSSVKHYKIGPLGFGNEQDVLMLGNMCNKAITKGDWRELPYPLDVKDAINFVSGWLKSVRRDKKYYPDIDGTVEEDAFTVKSMSDDIICLIIPTYSIYHK